MSGGVVMTLTGTPVTQAVLAMHDSAGTGMMSSNLAGTPTVNIADTTTFTIDATNVDLTN